MSDNKKYTTKKIESALKPWAKFKYLDVPINSINSRLLYKGKSNKYAVSSDNIRTNIATDNDSHLIKTNLLFVKNQSHNTIRFWNHWFLDINNEQRWHPGSGMEGDILIDFKTDVIKDNLKDILISINEFCDTCTYWYLVHNFHKDSTFHLAFFNCEIIFDHYLQTFYITLSIISFALYYLSRYILLLYFGILIFVMYLLSSSLKLNTISLYKCPHVYDNVRNRSVIKIIQAPCSR